MITIFTVLKVFKSWSNEKILKSMKGHLQAFGYAPVMPMYFAAITLSYDLYFLSRLAFHISHPLFAYECPPPIYWYIDAHLTPDPRFSKKQQLSRIIFQNINYKQIWCYYGHGKIVKDNHFRGVLVKLQRVLWLKATHTVCTKQPYYMVKMVLLCQVV